MKQISFKINGIAPLLLHNERLANPQDPHTKALKALTKGGTRNRTEATDAEVMKAEWRGGLYEAGGRVVIPADNIIACLKEGARKRKLGKQLSAAVFSDVQHFALQHDGPADLEELYSCGRFVDYRGVRVGQAKVMRTRPRFDAWSAQIVLTVDEELLSSDDFLAIATIAGGQIGLGEKRPQFGRFLIG